MIGSHCIRTWSSTQPSVTLSFREADFYGLVKASGAGLGHQSLLKDLGHDMPLCVWIIPVPLWALLRAQVWAN